MTVSTGGTAECDQEIWKRKRKERVDREVEKEM